MYFLVKGKNQSIYKRLLRLVETIANDRQMTIFNRPVRIMADFELAFINAVSDLHPTTSMMCCFFHFVNNLKKRAKRIVDALKNSAGKASREVTLAERTKRALMMLPLLPLDLITVQVVDMIVSRWRCEVPNHRLVFDDMRKHVVENYVKPNATFKKENGCVCGECIRTNNAAESSHAALNSMIRVSGAVSLDMFLYAVESQMRNTATEIKSGCPTHTRAIYAKRNVLLAKELSELFNGKQDALKFLDHCAMVMNVKNLSDFYRYTNRRREELPTRAEWDWITQNRACVVRAAISLHRRLCPRSCLSADDVLATVEHWSFQMADADVDLRVTAEDSVLSYARSNPRPSFDRIRQGLAWRNRTSLVSFETASDERGDCESVASARHVFQGTSYRLEIRM